MFSIEAAAFCFQTPPEFERQYKHLMSLPQYRSYSPLNFYGNAYDAMWAIAIGLHNADLRVQRGDASGCDHLPGELVPLHLFNYSNQLMGCVMKEGYAAENFTGITVNHVIVWNLFNVYNMAL